MGISKLFLSLFFNPLQGRLYGRCVLLDLKPLGCREIKDLAFFFRLSLHKIYVFRIVSHLYTLRCECIHTYIVMICRLVNRLGL